MDDDLSDISEQMKRRLGDYSERERLFFSGTDVGSFLEKSARGMSRSQRSTTRRGSISSHLDESLGSDEVRALAAVLAPQVQELDDFLDDPLFGSRPTRTKRPHRSSIGSEVSAESKKAPEEVTNDEMEEEEENLAFSEDILRQELDLANDFESFFKANSGGPMDDSAAGSSANADGSLAREQSQPIMQTHEADLDEDVNDEVQQDITESIRGHQLIAHAHAPASTAASTEAEATTAAQSEQVAITEAPKTDTPMMHDYVEYKEKVMSTRNVMEGVSTTPKKPPAPKAPGVLLLESEDKVYSCEDHFDELRMRREPKGAWYSVDLTHHVLSVPPTDAQAEESKDEASPERPNNGLVEYCLSLSEWKRLFVGMRLEDDKKKDSSKTGLNPLAQSALSKKPAHITTTLPVRTIAIRIRPDVLCGAVIDAVMQTMVNSPQASVKKRQGGHLQGTVQGSSPIPENATPQMIKDLVHPTFFVDAQLCTKKSSLCERVLLLRLYHWDEKMYGGDDDDDLWLPPPPPSDANEEKPTNEGDDLEDGVDQSANIQLREACALLQRMESPELAQKIRPLNVQNQPRESDMNTVVRGHLLRNYRPCPSVLQPGAVITLPALAQQDWPLIEASWKWIKKVWDELEIRELTYTCLAGVSSMGGFKAPRFGAFPALPTLDVQFCSQIRRFSREAMISNLLKAASELEDYARLAEYQCANMIDLLKPSFVAYGISAPSLPRPVPLIAYPLDFTPPQAQCPPWGMKVMDAINKVTAMSQTALEENEESGASIEMAEKAVALVLEAFQKQDDEEQGARLARKNLQVMDRLGKMQNHHKASIEALRNGRTAAARKAADDFFIKGSKAAYGFEESEGGTEKTVVKEIPLLKWGMGVGGTAGACIITTNQILFYSNISSIPLLGMNRSIWFNLSEVEFALAEAPTSMLNPLPTTIRVMKRGGEEVYTFRPSSASARLKSFLDVVQRDATGGHAALDTELAPVVEEEDDEEGEGEAAVDTEGKPEDAPKGGEAGAESAPST